MSTRSLLGLFAVAAAAAGCKHSAAAHRASETASAATSLPSQASAAPQASAVPQASAAPQASAVPQASASPQASAAAPATSGGVTLPQHVLSQRYEQLGPNYQLLHYNVRSRGFEAVAHYTALLYRGKDLTNFVDVHTLSPDGQYLVYDDGDGHNFVHSAASGKQVSVTPKPYAIPLTVVWHLDRHEVTVRFERPTRPITVKLP